MLAAAAFTFLSVGVTWLTILPKPGLGQEVAGGGGQCPAHQGRMVVGCWLVVKGGLNPWNRTAV